MADRETQNFSSLADIVEHASNSIGIENIESFIIENAARLNPPMEANELTEVIEAVLENVKIMRAKTPEEYLQDFKNEYHGEKNNFNSARLFIKTHLLNERKDVAEAFIIDSLKEHLSLSRDKTNNLKIFYKEEIKALKNKSKLKKTSGESLQVKADYTIDAEFTGLYDAVVSPITGKFVITPKHDKIAYQVIENLHVIMYSGNCFCYTDGYYKNNLIAVKAEATRILTGICKDTASNGVKRRLDDVITIIKNTNPVSEYPFNKYDNAVHVKNGVVVVDFEKGTFTKEDHDPEIWKFNYILPVEFDEKASGEIIVNELKKYTPNYKMLIQAISQALLQAMGYGPYKKAYLLKGGKNCGKTTFLDMAEKIIGESNKSKVALNELTPQYRFTRAEMEGKLMNIDDDLGYFKMSETGIFKKITGGYSQKIEKKGVDAYDIFMTAVHMFTTNTPAGFDSRIYVDEAFWDRWIYIEFNHVFVKDDEFKKRVLTEQNISGLFNEILKIIIEIRQKKQLPYVQPWTEVREKWTQESNVLYKFIEENMISGGRTAIIKEDLLAALTKFCYDRRIDTQLIPQNVNALGNLVEICGGSKDAQRQFKNTDGHNKHCFLLNYMWKPYSEYKNYAHEEKSQFNDAMLNKIKENNSIVTYADD